MILTAYSMVDGMTYIAPPPALHNEKETAELRNFAAVPTGVLDKYPQKTPEMIFGDLYQERKKGKKTKLTLAHIVSQTDFEFNEK